ncbi:phage tail length tape measure family protein [Pararhizobium sp. A13]|uniref:phage tail length tape measure family protein n=1 Tax=Pararhizobium sp. A13 TaxID=3133975 RepID=UPI0032495E3D
MAAPLKIAAKVEIDASQTAQGSAAASAAISGIGKAADQTAAKLRALDNAADGLAANVKGAGDRTAPLTAEGKALDDLRAKYNPLYATMRTYHQEVAAIKAAHVAGALSVDEMTAAIDRQRRAALSSMEALNGRNAALRNSAANANTANIAAQFQDIGVTAAMGMSPLQIALQQGTQLSAVIGSMDKPVQGLASAFMSIVNPLSLVTIGTVALAAAAIQYFSTAADEGKTLEAALDDQEKALKRIAEAYGGIARQAQAATAESTRLLNAIGTRSAAALRVATIAEAQSFFESENVGGRTRAGFVANEPKLQEALVTLRNQVKAGDADFEAFYATIERQVALDPSLADAASKIIAESEKLKTATDALKEFQRVRDAIFNDQGPNKLLLSRGTTNQTDAGNLSLYLSRERVEAERRDEAFQAQLAELYARSPAERAEAARRNAAADTSDESAPARRDRIEAAGKLALAAAEKELADAQRDRLLSLDSSVASQKLELSLIGQTAGEAARLRMEHDLTARVREDAAKRGVEVDQAELDLIRQKAAEYGKLTEQIAAANALRSQDNDIERLQAELSLVGASSSARAELLAALQAEQRIRELGLASGSAEANQFRTNAGLISDLSETIKRQAAAWESWQSAGENAIDNVLDKMVSGDFKGALTGLLKDLGSFFLDFGVKNPLKNSLFGSGLPTLANMASLVGGNQLNKSIGFAGANTTFGGVLGAANDNSALSGGVASAALSSVTNAAGNALRQIGNYRAGVDARLTDILDTAAKQFPGYQVDAISGFRAGDSRFHGKGLATDVQLTDLASGRMLGNYQDAASFGTYERFAQTARQVQMAKYPELAGDFRWGGYFGGGRGKYGAMDTMHFDLGGERVGMGGGSWESGLTSAQRALWPGVDSKGMDTASAALDHLAKSGQTATSTIGGLGTAGASAMQGLGQLGNGLGQFSQQLVNAANSGGGGGGGGFLGMFQGLLGGISPTSSFWTPNTTFGSFLVNGFDTGGWTGSMGRGDIAGFVHGQEFVVNAGTVAKPGVRSFLEALNDNRLPGFASGGFVNAPGAVYPRSMSEAQAGHSQAEGAPVFNIYVDNPRGDRDIEDAIDRGVRRGIKAYDKKQPARNAVIKKRPYVRGQ